MKVKVVGLGLLALFLTGCGSGETEPGIGRVSSFSTSGCKSKRALGAALTVESARALDSGGGAGRSALFDGLTCVLATSADDATVFQLLNFEDGCAIEHAGSAVVAPGGRAVTFSLRNPKGAVAACGSCLYDFRFEVTGAATDGPLTITVNGEGGTRESTTFTLSRNGSKSAAACRYANEHAIRQHAGTTGTSGRRHMPCDSAIDGTIVTCEDGTSCTAIEEGRPHKLCLPTCASDADCVPTDVLACQQGLCRVRAQTR